MDKIIFEDGVTKGNAETFNKMQDNIEKAINTIDTKANENAEEINKIEEKTNGMSKGVVTIQPGQYHQIAFSFMCGFASFRVFASNYEQNKIYAMMVSNKFASKISEIEGYLYANNPDISVTFEIIDGANDDWNKYIRINNTGSKEVTLSYGVLNMV